jgi:hypothetical protein
MLQECKSGGTPSGSSRLYSWARRGAQGSDGGAQGVVGCGCPIVVLWNPICRGLSPPLTRQRDVLSVFCFPLSTWVRLLGRPGTSTARRPGAQTPAFDSGAFAKGVTYDASEMAGSAPACIENVRATWDLLKIYGGDDQGKGTR